ncbi:MAG: hypothetical protein Q4D78_07590 [Neisseria zoodegmatis]|nr:hypothetical protein [Neisseria zoodegmatis]MDO5070044.1 hypothetical protein [Neisseria zoodegmatis]
MALDGILTSQPDGCEREICNSYIEQDLSEWQFDGSLKIQF